MEEEGTCSPSPSSACCGHSPSAVVVVTMMPASSLCHCLAQLCLLPKGKLIRCHHRRRCTATMFTFLFHPKESMSIAAIVIIMPPPRSSPLVTQREACRRCCRHHHAVATTSTCRVREVHCYHRPVPQLLIGVQPPLELPPIT